MLVLEADADDQPGEQPLALVSTAQDPGHDIHQRHPDEHVEGRRGEQVPQCHRRPRRGRCQRRHRLSCPSCAELSSNQGDKHHDERHRHGRQRPAGRAGPCRTPTPRSGRAAGSGPAGRRTPKRDGARRHGSTARPGDSRSGSTSQPATGARRLRPAVRAPRRLDPAHDPRWPTVSRRFRGRRAGSRTQKRTTSNAPLHETTLSSAGYPPPARSGRGHFQPVVALVENELERFADACVGTTTLSAAPVFATGRRLEGRSDRPAPLARRAGTPDRTVRVRQRACRSHKRRERLRGIRRFRAARRCRRC